MKIRLFQPADETAVRRICYDTALYGRPIAPVFPDPAFVGDAWILYYARFEPERFWVAEDEGRVAGYLTGSADTRLSIRRFARAVLPRLAGRFLVKGHWLRPLFWRLLQSFALGRARVARDRRRILETYPAHFHLNLAEGCRRRGIGQALVERWLRQLREESIPGVHAGVASEGGRRLLSKLGFNELARHPAPPLGPEPPADIIVFGKTLCRH